MTNFTEQQFKAKLTYIVDAKRKQICTNKRTALIKDIINSLLENPTLVAQVFVSHINTFIQVVIETQIITHILREFASLNWMLYSIKRNKLNCAKPGCPNGLGFSNKWRTNEPMALSASFNISYLHFDLYGKIFAEELWDEVLWLRIYVTLVYLNLWIDLSLQLRLSKRRLFLLHQSSHGKNTFNSIIKSRISISISLGLLKIMK